MVWLKRTLGATGCGSLQWRWLRFDVIQDLLDYVWVSDVGYDAHGATTQWTQADLDIKDSFESLGYTPEVCMTAQHQSRSSSGVVGNVIGNGFEKRWTRSIAICRAS